jgi:hypothetical protein
MRRIILHFHILKNAGTTVRSILESNFAGACGDIEGPNPWDTIESDRILEHVRSHPELKVISTHQGRLPVPVDPSVTFYPILFLRHPIDRAGSVYSFESREPLDSPGLGAPVARERGLTEYVKWRLTDGNGAVLRNFQTVHLAGRERDMRSAVANRADLELACQRLRDLPFFGIVEQFDQSAAAMKRFLEPAFGELEVSQEPQNITPGRKSCLQDRLHDLKAVLGLSLYDELIEKNALDLELYGFALDLLSSQQSIKGIVCGKK